ncbi:hypothetical protein [Candidatus Berkiella aquae]|uniref:Uncharacterized protein n=1 Tax=Candidatus Berkiella aquae TaxID=295108 RepID=A0A0Q9YNV2_9GAMM|nr:hypothetical protein [Candidatus Berkiella aquae]MCS5712150.1 hypothetical protein [Candidatus Berkiella aquae]
MKFLLNTTPWENSCGLAALSHVLTQNILAPMKRNPLNQQALNLMLSAFSTIYQVTELNWLQLRNLLQLYQHPEDQQKLWIGPLRLILSERLLSQDEYRNTLFHTFVAGLRHYVLEEQPNLTDEYANIYQTNKAFFEFARASYWRVRAVRRIDKERDIFQENALQAYWQQIGYIQYCHQHKQVIHHALMLTAEEMSHLCDALEIEFNIYESAADNSLSFNPINHTCKGFEGEASLDILDVICSNHHWQPLTDSMSEAFRQQLLWKNGYRQLGHHSYEALRQAGRAGLLCDTKQFTAPLLHKALQLRVYNQVAKICQSQADKRDPDNGFYNCIDEVISQKDLSMLLTIYYFKPNTRNYILDKSLRMYGTAFVADFLKYYQRLPKEMTDTRNWDGEIEKLLPCIDKIDQDSDLHIVIRKGETVKAKKLITEEEDIYLENQYQVSPLHLVCEKENLELYLRLLLAMTKKFRGDISVGYRNPFFQVKLLRIQKKIEALKNIYERF